MLLFAAFLSMCAATVLVPAAVWWEDEAAGPVGEGWFARDACRGVPLGVQSTVSHELISNTMVKMHVNQAEFLMDLINKNGFPATKAGLFAICRDLQTNIELSEELLGVCPNETKMNVGNTIRQGWKIIQFCENPENKNDYLKYLECSKALKKESSICKIKLDQTMLSLEPSKLTKRMNTSKICRAQETFIACVHNTSSRCSKETALYFTAKTEHNYYHAFENLTCQEEQRENENVFSTTNPLSMTVMVNVFIKFNFLIMLFVSLYAFYLVFKPINLPRNNPVNF